MLIPQPDLQDHGPLPWADHRHDFAVDQGLMLARQQQPETGNTVALADIVAQALQQVDVQPPLRRV